MAIEVGHLLVKVRGMTPLLAHSPQSMARGGTTTERKAIPSAEEEAELGCYRDPDGDACFPGNGFRASIVVASGQFREHGRSVKSKMSCIRVVEDMVKLRDKVGTPLTTYVIDERRVVIKSGGRSNGIIRARPRFDVWYAEFVIEYDAKMVLPEMIIQSMEAAGARIGIGNYRGNCGGHYGRFEILEARPLD